MGPSAKADSSLTTPRLKKTSPRALRMTALLREGFVAVIGDWHANESDRTRRSGFAEFGVDGLEEFGLGVAEVFPDHDAG
jgi:hypothetical protein